MDRSVVFSRRFHLDSATSCAAGLCARPIAYSQRPLPDDLHTRRAGRKNVVIQSDRVGGGESDTISFSVESSAEDLCVDTFRTECPKSRTGKIAFVDFSAVYTYNQPRSFELCRRKPTRISFYYDFWRFANVG